MDNNLVEVIAAAPGTILAVHDGEFDRNCTSNSLTANYIMIQHADGSQALYWHMKNVSVTTKTVGQTVTAGEHLGVVGSSGSPIRTTSAF
jgi:murein DD-endopeptidase MepM/ murein hydrolase activator NlpD